MRKRSIILFVFILIFWIVISGVVDLEHIVVGIFISSIIIWFSKDFSTRLPIILHPRELLAFGRCILMLLGNVITSNLYVAKRLLFTDLSLPSMFLELEPGIESDWGRVFLATCITITPGTVTIDFDPETNVFTVHSLTQEIGVDLYYWRLITEIKELENMVHRRETYDVDNGGVHGSNSVSTTESDNRTDSD